MKILIGGSMSFAPKMMEVKKALEELWHTVSVSSDIEIFLWTPKDKMSLEEELASCKETDIMREFFNDIANHEAILFLNYEKRWIPGYIGASVLMEIGIAYYLEKKIFLMNKIDRTQWYALEVLIADPTILNGNLSLI